MESPATVGQKRILIATHFLPVTLSIENVPVPSFPFLPTHSHPRSDSLTATAPPSRYHYRSDSNTERMPFSPRNKLSEPVHSSMTAGNASTASQSNIMKPLQQQYKQKSSASSTWNHSGPSPPLVNWSIVQSNMGNIGLFNAINSMENQWDGEILYVGQLGTSTDILNRDVKQEVTTALLRDHQSLPVFVSDAEAEGHYVQFCKETLWLTFHYILPEYLKTSTTEKTAWNHYVSVNQYFASVLAENYRDGDIVWVHDYHLMLVPTMLRKLLPNAKIGFFLHIPFPSNEVFRCLYGLLGADLIGFQTYSFARHFLATSSKILGYESTPKGIQMGDGNVVPVGIFPIGIDIGTLNKKRQLAEVQQMIKMLEEKYQGKKVIVARDKLDPVKGVRQKLLSFELFLCKYPEWQGKVVLVQVALSTTEHPELQRQVSDLASRINSKFGTIEYVPVLYLHQDISHSHYLALLTRADACLITSLRDGMNLTSHEYIACQEDNHSPLILSEFTGTYGSFGSAIRINPWDYEEVANSINEALLMSPEDRSRAHKELYKHVSSNTGSYWATSFINELEKAVSTRQKQ